MGAGLYYYWCWQSLAGLFAKEARKCVGLPERTALELCLQVGGSVGRQSLLRGGGWMVIGFHVVVVVTWRRSRQRVVGVIAVS